MQMRTSRGPLSRNALVFLMLLLSLAVFAACRAQNAAQPQMMDLDSYTKGTLEIQAASGQQKQTHRFDIWFAETPRQQQQGLMFVRDLAENRGMLFIAEPPRVFGMWMMNTYIPLDMVFIGADG